MKICQSLVCCLLGALPWATQAKVTAQGTINVSVTVQVPAASCELKSLSVAFGDVLTTRVDGNYKREPVRVTASCTGVTGANADWWVKGDRAAFGTGVLKTDKTGLGIAFLRGGTRWNINTKLTRPFHGNLDLEAVLVKDPKVTLEGGKFNASATLVMGYE